MANNSLVTSVTHTSVDVVTGKQKKYWTEVQLVDELGHSVSGMSFKIENDATRCNFTSVYTGSSDADGVIRVENLHWLDLTLTIDAQQLADEMESRTLAVLRNPTHQPQSAESFIARSKGAKSSFKSEVQEKAESEGFLYQYVTIGELCNQAPEIEGWDQTELPEFHFPPQRSLKGYAIEKENLNRRVVIEVCPFRAWVLDLHDTKDYSLANGLNLGIMADLAYSDEKNSRLIKNFFLTKCQDLSSIPQFAEYPSYYHTLAVDVPFSQRYLKPTYINTRDTEQPEGDTRLFYVECSTHLIVAWCGTDSLLNAVTDASFAPKKCPDSLADSGNLHGGFLDAYHLAKNKFNVDFSNIRAILDKRKSLFVCGHSLGGALALIFSAEMKNYNPILHSYGMPRTFTMSALQSINNITHYRHVNDNDTVTQIPPDADLDSALYEKFGPIGEKLGFNWVATTGLGIGIAINQLGMQSLGLQVKKDPYWHHGNIVIFFQAQRCVMKKNHQNAPWIGGGGRDNPAPGIVYSCDYAAVKLFLVPSLNEESLKSSGEHQATFIQRIGTSGLDKIFPHNSNPTLDGLMTNAGSHSMAHKYLPYIHNQVLELADPVRPMGRKEMRDAFQRDMELAANSGNSNQDELERNRIFYQLQNMLSVSLDLTRKEVTGRNALIRFAEMTEEEVELSK